MIWFLAIGYNLIEPSFTKFLMAISSAEFLVAGLTFYVPFLKSKMKEYWSGCSLLI